MVGKLQLVPSLALEFLGMPKSWESYLSPVGSQPELRGGSWHRSTRCHCGWKWPDLQHDGERGWSGRAGRCRGKLSSLGTLNKYL